jgi:4-azaleucine resistance transporter AzlC
MMTRRQEFIAGVKDTIPLIIGAIPFGIIFGAVAVTSGLSPLAALGMSLFVFAGSAQFMAVGLVAQSTAGIIIILTTFVINLRHALYGASLAPYVRQLSQRWLLPLAFWLTDESFAVVIRRYQTADDAPNKHWYFLGSTIAMYINWQLCTLIGIVAGQQLEGLGDLGLDFAMVVTFIGIIVPLIISRPMLACALTAGLVSVLTAHFPHKLGLLLAALAGIAAGLAADSIYRRQRGETRTTAS